MPVVSPVMMQMKSRNYCRSDCCSLGKRLNVEGTLRQEFNELIDAMIKRGIYPMPDEKYKKLLAEREDE